MAKHGTNILEGIVAKAMDAAEKMADESVIALLAVVGAVVSDDVLWAEYLNAVTRNTPLPEGATGKDLRNMLRQSAAVVHLMYAEEIAEAKAR
jgi:hypothetical protein